MNEQYEALISELRNQHTKLELRRVICAHHYENLTEAQRLLGEAECAVETAEKNVLEAIRKTVTDNPLYTDIKVETSATAKRACQCGKHKGSQP